MGKAVKLEKIPFVSVIIPTRDSEQTVGRCLESITKLDYPKERLEVIVSDGLSSDQTRDIVKNCDVKLIDNHEILQAAGRNRAFKESKGDIIAFTDSDCVVEKDWLKNSLKYLEDERIACVGGPNITPQDDTDFSKAIGFVFDQPLFAGGSTNSRVFKKVKTVKAIAFSNAIFKRKVLDEVLPINEMLLTCTEPEFGKRIMDSGYILLYTPDTIVWHYRRSDIKKLWNQMYRYAIGRLQLGKRERGFLNIAHVAVGLSLPLSFAILLVSFVLNRGFFMAILELGLAFLLFYFALSLIRNKSFLISIYVPVVILTIMTGWSCGFLRELFLPTKKRNSRMMH